MSSIDLVLPALDLDTASRACDPAEPLEPNDLRYADLTTVRHSEGILSRRRQFSKPVEHQHGCFCGHRGSGKSTELLAFKRWADQNGFLAVLTEVDEHLGLTDLEFSDLYLLAAYSVEAAMKSFGAPLPEAGLKHVIAWFDEITKEDHEEVKSEIATEIGAQVGGNVPFSLGNLFAKFTAGVKAGSSHAMTVRKRIRNSPERLIDLTNSLLDTANLQLSDRGRTRGIFLLFDNLDRYDPGIIDKLLYRSSNLVRSMKCHAIYAIPIALEYEPLSGAIQDCYGFSTVLPMAALRDPLAPWGRTVAETSFDQAAVDTLRTVLARRLDIGLFEDPADVDLLIRMSGGCIRDLMHFIQEAFNHSGDEDKFTCEAVRKAIRTIRATYFRRLTQEDYRVLARIARKESLTVEDDAILRRLLYHRFALEYQDTNDQPWLDVHPIVVETEGFQHAFRG